MQSIIITIVLQVVFFSRDVIATSQAICSDPNYHMALASCLGGEVTLLGTYVQVGVHSCASYGTAKGSSSSMKPGAVLGLVADFDENGFNQYSYCDVAEAWYYYYGGDDICPTYSGDFITPGNPIEGMDHPFCV